METLQAMMEEIGHGGKASKAQNRKAFEQLYLPTMRQITKSIFTPERIGRLVAELRAYRKDLAAAGDKRAVMGATSAILYVERETAPDMNSFLVALCGESIMKLGAALAEETGETSG
jgi:hypothetical protein